MNRKPPYTECRIYIDGCPELQVGEYIVTTGGSGYRVQSMRQDRKRPRRRHLVCLRWPIAEIPEGSKVYEFRWYPRKKKRATTLADIAARTA